MNNNHELFEDVVKLPYEKNEKRLVKHKSKFSKHNDILNQLIEEAKQKNLTGGQMGHAIIELYKHDNMIGGSFWSDLVGVISDVLPFIAPALNLVPIVGPLLSVGATGLSTLGKVGTELYRQKEEDDYGLPSISGLAKSSLKRVKNIGKDVVEYFEDKDKNITGFKPTKLDGNVYRQQKNAPSIERPKSEKPKPIDKSKPYGLGKRPSKKGTKAMYKKTAKLRSLKKGGKSRITQAIEDVKNFERPTGYEIGKNAIKAVNSLISSGVAGYLDYKEKYDDKPKPKEPTRQNYYDDIPEYNPRPFLDDMKYVMTDNNPSYFDDPNQSRYSFDDSRYDFSSPFDRDEKKYEDDYKESKSIVKQNKYDKASLTKKMKKYLDEKQSQLKSKTPFYNDPEDQDPDYTVQPRKIYPDKKKSYLRKGFESIQEGYKMLTKPKSAELDDVPFSSELKRQRGRPKKIDIRSSRTPEGTPPRENPFEYANVRGVDYSKIKDLNLEDIRRGVSNLHVPEFDDDEIPQLDSSSYKDFSGRGRNKRKNLTVSFN